MGLTAIGIQAALPHPHDQIVTPEVSPPAGEDESIATVTVTGIRASATGPVHTGPAAMNSDEPAAGRASVAEHLSLMRQVFGSQDAVNGPTGTALEALQDLRSQRTPVLEERRMPHAAALGTPARNPRAADPDEARSSISDRVSSLAGSPSSVSGMLGFIVNRHFAGIRVTSSYGFYSHDSGATVKRAPSPNPPPPATFTDTVATAVHMLSTTLGQQPAT
jgi:hypothetical protein